MALFFFVFLTLFCAGLLELQFGAAGFLVPLTLPVVFYFSIACGWRTGLFCAIAAGTALDILYGRHFPVSSLLISIAALLSIFWILREESKNPLLNVIPGALTGIIYMAPLCFSPIFSGQCSWKDIFTAFVCCFSGVLISVISFPAIIIFLDGSGRGFGFPLFKDARDRLLKKL